MKKISTLIAALAFVGAANAQSTGVVTFNTLVSEAALGNIEIANDGSLTGTVAISDGLSASALQTTYKDLTGTSTKFDEVGGKGYIKFAPTAESSINSGTDGEADYSAYVDFTVEETDVNKSFGGLTIEFDATRLGTDAVRLNAEVLTSGNSDETTGKLLTADAWQNYADGESYATWSNSETGASGSYDCGWTPIREDLSKGTNSAQKTNPMSHVKIVNPKMAEEAYQATLRIYVTGIANNKAFMIENVKFTFAADAAAVAGVAEVKEQPAKAIKTVGGIIVNGVKYNYGGQMIK